MPLKACEINGAAGWRWGDAGTCYPGPTGRRRALRQAAAIKANTPATNAAGGPTAANRAALAAPAVGIRPNPLALDPTRTTMLRRRYMAEMAKRFRALRGAIRRKLVTDDALGLRTQPGSLQFNTLTLNAPVWQFLTDAQKLAGFQAWFVQQVAQGVLAPAQGADPDTPWMTPYVDSAYMQGVQRAYTETHAEAMAEGLSDAIYEGGQEAFLASSFSGQVATNKIKLLATRNLEQLKGVTAAMGQQMSRVLSDGLVGGHGPAKIAKAMNEQIEGITKKRAMTIARTEIIHAHAEGQLDSFDAMNVEKVGALAEWATAGDGKVCPICAPLEGAILTIKEARGLIPRHPNCRCMWLPAAVGEETTGQTWAGDEINSIARQSMKRETGQQDGKKARAASRWLGATKKFTDKGKLKPTKKHKAAKAAKLDAAAKAKAAKAAASLEIRKAKAAAAAAAAKAKAAEVAAAAAKAKADAAALHAAKLRAGEAKAAAKARWGLTEDDFALDTAGVAVLTPAAKAKLTKAKAAAAHSKKVKEGMAKGHFVKKIGVDPAHIKSEYGDPVKLTSLGKVQALQAKGFTGWADPDLPDHHIDFLTAKTLTSQKTAYDKLKHPLYKAPATPAPANPILAKNLGASHINHRAAGKADFTKLEGWAGSGKKSYGGVVVDDRGRVLLREPTGHYDGYAWTFPKGGVEAGDNPLQTALKEVAEETGHKGRTVGYIPGAFKGGTSDVHMFLMKSEGVNAGAMDTETSGLRWVTKEEAAKLIKKSKNQGGQKRDLAILDAAYEQIDFLADPLTTTKTSEMPTSVGTSVQAHHFDDALLKPKPKPKPVPKPKPKPVPKPKPTHPLGPVQDHPDDEFHDTFLKAAKTVSHHAGDGNYNAATLAEFSKASDKAAKALAAGGLDADTEEMLSYYVTAADSINAAKQAGQKLSVDGVFGWQGGHQTLGKFQFRPEIKPPGPGDMVPVGDSAVGGGTFKNAGYVVTKTNIGGSTGAVKVRVKEGTYKFGTVTAKESDWVLKDYSGRSMQAENEFVANGIYNLAAPGSAPKSRLALVQNRDGDTSTGVFNEFMEGGQEFGELSGDAKSKAHMQARENFVLDAWVGNWDAVGSGGDNMMVLPSGKVVRIDNGGALLFRARGGFKGKQFAGKVGELESLLDAGKNPDAAAVYKGINKKEVARQIADLEDSVAQQGGVDAFLRKAGVGNISDPAMRKEVQETLSQRLEDLSRVRDDIEGITRVPMKQRVARIKDVQVLKQTTQTENTHIAANKALLVAARKHQHGEVVKFTGHSSGSINKENMEAIKKGGKAGKRAARVNRQLAKLPGFEGVVARGQSSAVPPELWEKWQSGDYAQVHWACPSSSSAQPGSEFASGSDGVCYIVLTKGRRNAWVQEISDHDTEYEALFMGDSVFRVRGTATGRPGHLRRVGGHPRLLVIEEMPSGKVPPEKQQAPPKLDGEAVWAAYQNDANRAGMTSRGDRKGTGVEALIEAAEAKAGGGKPRKAKSKKRTAAQTAGFGGEFIDEKKVFGHKPDPGFLYDPNVATAGTALDIGVGKKQELKISDLIPTQEYTGAAKAKSIGKEFDPKLAEVGVLKYGGKYFIHDGHHTAAAAKYAGQQTIEAKVVEVADDDELDDDFDLDD